ncbi:sensor histidine kinase [Suicoccus acidiformans]|uniref:histidine kinase n=1 Tax=Suicoccus acidiformans TaxID=2036206 RepID=A0A347WN96_9LACT|nr:HAMP domain-containing sensor histidine kinase [Suicoccus acidiformans]AXY26553.1 sensor histidine kinase [Suicoccus acidiformans]
MKFFWQQFLSFLVLLLLTVAIMTNRMVNNITDELTQNRQEQLLNYGYNIINNNFSREDLVRTSQLLASENILIQVYLPDGSTIYPTYDQRFDANLDDSDLIRIAQGEILGFRTVDRQSKDGKIEPYLIVYLPHQNVGQFPEGFISLGAPLDSLEGQLADVQKNILASFIFAVMVGIVISYLLAIYQNRKIKRLQEATKVIASGQYDIDLDTSGNDEFANLTRDFKAMADSLAESQEEIERQEELRRQFMMDVAHEMRTPLTTMSGLLEGLQYNMIPESQRERSLELIAQETARLTRLVNENLDYEKVATRQIYLNKRAINGREFFEQIYQQMSVKAEGSGDRIVVEASDQLIFWADYDRLVQIVINLVTNAIQFSQESDIILKGFMTDDASVIQVIDHGIGISPKDQRAIWERFYKVDESRKNTEYGESGIGLSLVKSLVEAHEGTIAVESELNVGSTFTVRLPHQTHTEEGT